MKAGLIILGLVFWQTASAQIPLAFHHLEMGFGAMPLSVNQLQGDRFLAGIKNANNFDASRLDSNAVFSGILRVTTFDLRFALTEKKRPSVEWIFGISNHRLSQSLGSSSLENPPNWFPAFQIQQFGLTAGRIRRYRAKKRLQFTAGVTGSAMLPVAAKTLLQPAISDTAAKSYRFFAAPPRTVHLSGHLGAELKLTKRTGFSLQFHPGLHFSRFDNYPFRGRAGWTRLAFTIYPR